jgi:hypothetical protein
MAEDHEAAASARDSYRRTGAIVQDISGAPPDPEP